MLLRPQRNDFRLLDFLPVVQPAGALLPSAHGGGMQALRGCAPKIYLINHFYSCGAGTRRTAHVKIGGRQLDNINICVDGCADGFSFLAMSESN